MRKNCSGDQEKLLKFEGEDQEFAKWIEQFIRTVNGPWGQYNKFCFCIHIMMFISISHIYQKLKDKDFFCLLKSVDSNFQNLDRPRLSFVSFFGRKE